MAKYRAIPEGYMTVGQMAEKMGVTVRTLQYYDKEGVLSPSAQSEGGRRLYTNKDLITLHEILSLKSLGFSLEDIKERLPSLDTPEDVAKALEEQAGELEKKIGRLKDSLEAVRRLRNEVLQMQTVDFKKYADIIVNLQMKNEFYFLIKHFDGDTLDHIRRKFDEKSGMEFIGRFTRLCDKILELQKADVPKDSRECQELIGEFWGMVMEFTDGDLGLLPKLIEIGKFGGGTNAWEEKQQLVNAYVEPALEIYFQRLGIQP